MATKKKRVNLIKVGDLTGGEKLLLLRRRNKQSRVEAAEAFKLDLKTYTAFEKGIGKPPKVKLGPLTAGERCYINRKRAEETLESLSKKAGVCRWWINQIEHDRVNPEKLVAYWEA